LLGGVVCFYFGYSYVISWFNNTKPSGNSPGNITSTCVDLINSEVPFLNSSEKNSFIPSNIKSSKSEEVFGFAWDIDSIPKNSELWRFLNLIEDEETTTAELVDLALPIADDILSAACENIF